MPPQKKSDENIGCLLFFVFACVVGGVVWYAAFDCFLADQFDYVTRQCALTHLKKPACNADRDILEVDEVTDVSTTNAQGQRDEVRSVIYRFRKRPTSGPVSDTVMRDTASLFKLKDGRWLASCENLSQ